MRLTGWLSSRNFSTPVGNQRGTWEREDHGLIVRGPHPKHPKHPGRTVTIMAGPHSLGTGAACLAATKPQLVRKVADKLADKSDLSSHDRYFWVLVKATASHDYHVDDSSVEVVEASVYG